MTAGAVVDIDLSALSRNYAVLARAAQPGACGAVVKANAYGLGVGAVARRLADDGCRHFFVATPNEGIELRRILPDPEIFVLEGLCGESPDALQRARLMPVLNTLAEMTAWGASGPAAVHIDSGMSRLGLAAGDVARIDDNIARAIDVAYVLTHLACADEPEHPMNRQQLERFNALRARWPDAKTSIGNSAGLLLGEEFRSDVARPGIALYGANPFTDAPSPVEPVVTVRARILQLREVPAGASVGYGASFVATSAMRIAVVAIGYADGYRRNLGNRAMAAVAGRRVAVVGRVSMDLAALDVSALGRDEVREGDWATMIGGLVPLEEVAALAGTISYEILTSLGTRLERRYVAG
jgi:alanine racemase